MKKTVFTILVWNFFQTSFAQQLTNADFSLWTSVNGVKNPSSWDETSNDYVAQYNDPQIPLTVTQVTGVEAYGGQGSSVLLETKKAAGAFLNNGYKAINGYIYREDNLTNANVVSISFDYKANIVDGDKGMVRVVLRDNASIPVVEEAFFLNSANNSSNWISKTIPLSKKPGVTSKPVKIEISAYSTDNGTNQLISSPKIGSKLYLDNFKLNYTGTASVDDVAVNRIKIYPNPVHDKLTIHSMSEVMKTEVLGMDGRIFPMDNSTNTIDVSLLSEGIYQLRVYYADGEQSTHRILKF